MVTMSTIGRYIWKLRQERGGKGYWGLRAVSERIKISHPYLSQLENGKAMSITYDKNIHFFPFGMDTPAND
jgi:transcriptional regulator with XRE-family HTH domain